MELVRQVLDQQVLDREDNPIGKVDGVVLGLRDDAPPLVLGVELGGSVLAMRVHPLVARVVAGIQRICGLKPKRATRIGWHLVRKIGLRVVVDVHPDQLAVHEWESWLRENVVRRIPGGSDDGDPERHHQ